MVTPRFRIPTFEELIERRKLPKVKGVPVPEVSPLSSKLPKGFNLSNIDGVNTIETPRGLTLRNVKLEGDKITDFQAFKGTRPVKLPPSLIRRGAPAIKPIAPVEPQPLIEQPTPPITPPQPVEPITAQARVETQIGRKLTVGETLGATPIPELGNRLFTQALGQELTREALLAAPPLEAPPVEPARGTARTRIEAQIGRKLSPNELFGTSPILELGNRYFTPALTQEFEAFSPESREWLAGKLKELESLPWEATLVEIRRQAKEAGIELPADFQAGFGKPPSPKEGAGFILDVLTGRRTTENPEGLNVVEFARQFPAAEAAIVGLPIAATLGVAAVAAIQQSTNILLYLSIRRNLNLQSVARGSPLNQKDAAAFAKNLTDMLSRRFSTGQNWKNIFDLVRGKYVPKPEIVQEVNNIAQQVVRQNLPSLLSQATQTGITRGGLAAEGGAATIQSIVAKITANQPLNLEERQLYANQSQAVETALQAQPEAVPTTEAIPPEVPAVSEVAQQAQEAGYTVVSDVQNLPIVKEGFTRLYHGTFSKNLQSIKEQGLIMGGEGRPVLATNKPQLVAGGSVYGNVQVVFDVPTSPRVSREASMGSGIVQFNKILPEQIVGVFIEGKPVLPTVTPPVKRPTTRQAALNAQRAAKEREAQVFKETEAKFAEEAAATETIAEREARRKVTPPVSEGVAVGEITGDVVIPQLISDPSGTVAAARPTADFFPDIKPATKLPVGTVLRVTVKAVGEKQTSFWARVEERGGKSNIYTQLDKESQVVTTKTKEAGDTTIKQLVFHGAIVREQLARENILLGELQVVKIASQPTPEATQAITEPVTEGVSAIPPTEVTTPQQATLEVEVIQEQGKVSPERVPPDDARTSHVELAAPDGPQPPKPPTTEGVTAREPDDILNEITEKGFNERADQTLLRLHEGAINAETTRTNITVRGGGDKLKEQGIGVWRRDHLIPRPKDIEKLDELNIALHNPSGVASGEVAIPKGYEEIYAELRDLADWDTASRLDADPKAMTLEDWFFRGWKPPTDMFTGSGAKLGVKPRALRTPRIDATYQEMRDLGFEPLFWNPYEQWAYRHNLGIKYREQMKFIDYLKGMGDELIRPHDGGPVPIGWKVPEIGPAFEGKPFAIQDPDTGLPSVMYSRRWITINKIAGSLENIYGKKPNLGKFVVPERKIRGKIIIKAREIDKLAIIDAVVFGPKRAKLFLSFFQQVDFLTRAGANSWAKAVDDIAAGQPIDAVKSLAKFPKAATDIIQANFSPTKRHKLSELVNDTTPLVEGHPDVNFKNLFEAGLSTMDVTIFPEGMDKLVREVANETGALKKIPEAIEALESAMRRGLFQGVYPAAITTSVKNNIAPMTVRQHQSLNDAQLNSLIAREANMLFSTIPPSQSVIQGRILREILRRLFFSVGESEGLLRQATNAMHGPNKRFWGKHWLGVWLFLIATGTVISYASTGKPLPKERYLPISKDKWGPLPFGYNTEFAAPTLPIKGRGDVELTLDLAGQMDTAFRVLDPINFLTSRESVPVRAAMNQITGTDFYGAPIDDVGPGGIISRTSQLLHDLFAPIGLGGITGEAAREFIPGAEEIVPRAEDRLGFAGQAIQATGLNVRAETTMNLLDRTARESGLLKADDTPVESWADLEPYQKKEISKDPALEEELGLRSEAAVERQMLGALGFATLDELDKERVTRGEGLVSVLFRDLEAEDADRSNEAFNFRKEATALKREISIRKSQVDEDFQLFKETGKLEKDPNKRALTEYYNTYDLAKNKVTKVIDWDKQDKLEIALRRKWSGAQEAYVDRNIGLTEWGPLFNEYEIQRRALSESGYWDTDPKDRKTFRRANPDIEAILTGEFYGYVPLSAQISRTTGRAVPTGAFGGAGSGAVRPRSGTTSFPTFPRPRTGTSVRAPRVPGF